jgi:amino acid transporter
MLLGILISTILILGFRFVLNININILRTVLVYFVIFILDNILWQIERKKIKFTILKYSIFMGMLGWGTFCATIITLFLNNPFDLRVAIINYLLFLIGGFLWGIITYILTKYFEKKKKQKREIVKN